MARLTGFVFQDEYLVRLAKLSDQELGRLVRALAVYHATGETQELAGRESIAYDFIKADIDRIDENYNTKCEKNRANVNNRYQPNDNKSEDVQPYTNVYERTQDKDKDKDIKEKPPKGGKKKSAERFTPPTLAEVEAYCQERGNSVNAQRWYDFYSAKGWKIGQNTMKDWRAAVRTWEQRDGRAGSAPAKKVTAQNYTQRQYTEEQLALVTNNPILKYLEEEDAKNCV